MDIYGSMLMIFELELNKDLIIHFIHGNLYFVLETEFYRRLAMASVCFVN